MQDALMGQNLRARNDLTDLGGAGGGPQGDE